MPNNNPLPTQALEHIPDAVLAKHPGFAPVPAAPSILSFHPDSGAAPSSLVRLPLVEFLKFTRLQDLAL